jgi:hypothetical protein
MNEFLITKTAYIMFFRGQVTFGLNDAIEKTMMETMRRAQILQQVKEATKFGHIDWNTSLEETAFRLSRIKPYVEKNIELDFSEV